MKTVRILVPPGIGDGYWVLVKLRGFMERNGIQRAAIFVHDAGPRRADGMWKRVPFVEFGGYAPVSGRRHRLALQRAYRLPGYSVQKRVCGFDYMLSFNGTLDAGRSLDQGLPGPTNWYETMHDELVTQPFAAQFGARFGEYVVASFWDHGFYRHWLSVFPETAIIETLQRLADTGRTVVVMGAAWDRGAIADRLAAADPRFVGLVGETDFDGLTGLLQGAEAIVGFPAGNTLIGPYFRRPTVLLWHQHFPRAFWRNACPADPAIYLALDSAAATPASVSDAVQALIGERQERVA